MTLAACPGLPLSQFFLPFVNLASDMNRLATERCSAMVAHGGVILPPNDEINA
jgi:hypothetical protein